MRLYRFCAFLLLIFSLAFMVGCGTTLAELRQDDPGILVVKSKDTYDVVYRRIHRHYKNCLEDKAYLVYSHVYSDIKTAQITMVVMGEHRVAVDIQEQNGETTTLITYKQHGFGVSKWKMWADAAYTHATKDTSECDLS